MKLGTRLNTVLTQLLLLQDGGAVDYSRDSISTGKGGHGTHKERGKAPTGTSRPLVRQWAERFERLIELAEVDAGMRPAPVATERKNMRAELRSRMREYEGYGPVDVAFFERCSVDLVREVRKAMGLNMLTGRRLTPRERPLTAHPSHTLKTVNRPEAQ